MEKVIKGKRYNTDTARKIGGFKEFDPLSPDYIKEDLFVKKSGEYFLFCEGGSKSRYAQRSGSSWVNGSKIVPLSYTDAMSWSMDNLDEFTFRDEFYDDNVHVDYLDGKKVTFSTRINKALLNRFEKYCRRMEVSKSDKLERILLEYLNVNEFL